MNKYQLLQIAPVSQATRLRIRRYFFDIDVAKERRAIVRDGGDPSDVWDRGNWQFDYQELEEDEAQFHSRSLLSRARKLRIPTPPLMVGDLYSPDYQRSKVDGHSFYLSLTGEQKVRAAIREEETYRSQRWVRRIPYITALSGLVGTVTGLVALLLR